MKRTRKNPTPKTTNPYKAARLRAAQSAPELATAENAAELLLIRREKYLQIEQDVPGRKTADPTADDVQRMIRLYRAPELRSYYCSGICPLGGGDPIDCSENLDRISVRLLVALRRMEQARDELDSILLDGLVGENEAEDFKRIIQTLKDLAEQADALEIWAQRKGLLDIPQT